MNYTPAPCIFHAIGMFKENNVLASTGVYAALSDKVERGEYYRHNLKNRPRGPAADHKNGPLLWDLSAKCVQEKIGSSVPYADAPEIQKMA